MVMQCAAPTAPFYGWDRAVLVALDAVGVALPCDMLASALGGAMVGALCAAGLVAAWVVGRVL